MSEDNVTDGIGLLCSTAAALGFLHTLLGPDHYLPFVAMSRAGRWSARKTAVITLLCGLGHVLSSLALGTVGIALGVGVFKLEAVEGFRGDLAAWLLLTFGLVYFAWGVRRAIRNRPHTHRHVHADGTVHTHEHMHNGEHLHAHVHDDASARAPWMLFTIFLFGPCEPLIPLLIYPAANGPMRDVVLVAAVFGVTTLATMTAVVLLANSALGRLQFVVGGLFARLERFSHAIAGLVVLLCGVAVKVGL